MSPTVKLEPWRQLYRYWLSKHVGSRPPARSEIDPPIEIPTLVANLVLLAKADDGQYLYRLVGTAVEERAGMGLTGRRIGASSIPSTLMKDWLAGLDEVSTTQKPRLYVSRLPEGVIAKYVTLLLPLVHPDGRTDQILVGSFYDGFVAPGTRAEGMTPIEIDL